MVATEKGVSKAAVLVLQGGYYLNHIVVNVAGNLFGFHSVPG